LVVGIVAAGAGVAGSAVAGFAAKQFAGKGMIQSAVEEEEWDSDKLPPKPTFLEKIMNRIETDDKYIAFSAGIATGVGLGVAGSGLYVQAMRNKAVDDAEEKMWDFKIVEKKNPKSKNNPILLQSLNQHRPGKNNPILPQNPSLNQKLK
jgi:hypothetical protein